MAAFLADRTPLPASWPRLDPAAASAAATTTATATATTATADDPVQGTLTLRGLTGTTLVGADPWRATATAAPSEPAPRRQPFVLDVDLVTRITAAAQQDLLEPAAGAAAADMSINYGDVTRGIMAFLEPRDAPAAAAPPPPTIPALASALATHLMATFTGLQTLHLQLDFPKACRFADRLGVRLTMARPAATDRSDAAAAAEACTLTLVHTVTALTLPLVLGLHPWERCAPQRVMLSLQLAAPSRDAPTPDAALRRLAAHLAPAVGPVDHAHRAADGVAPAFRTLEALTMHCIAFLGQRGWPDAAVWIQKESAVLPAAAAGCAVHRAASRIESTALTAPPPASAPPVASTVQAAPIDSKPPTDATPLSVAPIVYLALGANLGWRREQIHRAIVLLEEKGLTLVNTSHLYESAPMYVTDQPAFLNACIAMAVPPSMTPAAVLHAAKWCEHAIGREFATKRWGPRTVDIDLLFWTTPEATWQLGADDPSMAPDAFPPGCAENAAGLTLTLPHPRMHERAFVMQPLADMVPDMRWDATRTIGDVAAALNADAPDALRRVLVFPSRTQEVVWPHTDAHTGALPEPRVMGIVNLAPDSFSDGGVYAQSPDTVLRHCRGLRRDGADLLDFGAVSTRPHAPDVALDEELRRLLPPLWHVREAMPDALVSVDTCDGRVAARCLSRTWPLPDGRCLPGIDLLNDITGGRDVALLRTVAQAQIPICLMHMRGTPQTMHAHATYTDVVAEVRCELDACVARALREGIYRWNIVVDPGVGFAKTGAHNRALIARLADALPPHHYALLGTSRKGFIGALLAAHRPPHADAADAADAAKPRPAAPSTPSPPPPPPVERDFGTVATCLAGLQQGVQMFRVHHVRAAREALVVFRACVAPRAAPALSEPRSAPFPR